MMAAMVNGTWLVYVITTSAAAYDVTMQINSSPLTLNLTHRSMTAEKRQQQQQRAAALAQGEWMTSFAHTIMANVILPTIVVLGTLANVWVFALLWRRPRKTSVHVYVSVLTFTCALVLAAGTGYTWLVDMAHWLHVGNVSEWTCKLWQFVYNVLVYTPNWLLVALVADQTLLARHSRAARELCRPCAARVVVIAMATLLASVAVHVMWTYELTRSLGCNVNPRRRDFFTAVWPYIAASLYLYLPFLLALVLAGACFAAILTTGRTKIVISQTLSTASAAAAAAAAASTSNVRPAARQPAMALAVTLTFIGLLMPGVLLNIVGHVMTVGGKWVGDGDAWVLAYVACQLLACLGYFSVPVICILSDRSLRHQVAQSFTCRSITVTSSTDFPPTNSTEPTPFSLLASSDATAAIKTGAIGDDDDANQSSVESHSHVTIYRCHSNRTADPVTNIGRRDTTVTEMELALLWEISASKETMV